MAILTVDEWEELTGRVALLRFETPDHGPTLRDRLRRVVHATRPLHRSSFRDGWKALTQKTGPVATVLDQAGEKIPLTGDQVRRLESCLSRHDDFLKLEDNSSPERIFVRMDNISMISFYPHLHQRRVINSMYLNNKMIDGGVVRFHMDPESLEAQLRIKGYSYSRNQTEYSCIISRLTKAVAQMPTKAPAATAKAARPG